MMNLTTYTEGDDELRNLLSLTERGMGAVQEMLSVLRENDRAAMNLVQRNRRLMAAAWSDMLTGLLNRRGLDETMAREEARASRYGTPAAVVLVDVSGLKAVNDQHGHLAGDALLRSVGAGLRDAARASDVVARFGGDEFAALLPGANLAGAEAFLTRARAATRFAQLPGDGVIPVRLAAGIATREEAGSLPAALELADQRLVIDKQQHRV